MSRSLQLHGSSLLIKVFMFNYIVLKLDNHMNSGAIADIHN